MNLMGARGAPDIKDDEDCIFQ